MVVGIGLDLVELERIERVNTKSAKFRERILTAAEQAQYEQYTPQRQLEFLAGRFAAKEAFSKALGTGIGKACRFQDIEVSREESGKPFIRFKGTVVDGLLSITHTHTMAAAQVVLRTFPESFS